MNFTKIWLRIQAATEIKNLNELAEKVGTSQPTVSRVKKEGHFPVDWAYKIGREYNLLTEWIMEGTGPMRIGEEKQQEVRPETNAISLTERLQQRRQEEDLPINDQLIPINEWLAQLPVMERLEFLNSFREKYPDFESFWQKKTGKEEDNDIDVAEDTAA